MRRLADKLVLLIWAALCLFAIRADAQTALEETLSGPDSHETGQGPTDISWETGVASDPGS
jgi:hypothetical protein